MAAQQCHSTVIVGWPFLLSVLYRQAWLRAYGCQAHNYSIFTTAKQGWYSGILVADMKYLRQSKEEAEKAIAHAICNGLFDGKRVLWLVSGGSNIEIERHIMDMVRNHANGKLGGLAILPIDERYGPPGHKDSNVAKLRNSGFDGAEATLIDVLMRDQPFEETVSFYSDVTAVAIANASTVVGQIGMGADGHIAGIKPESPATSLDESIVVGYEWDDYKRMTLSANTLKKVTNGFLVAYGQDKKGRLEELKRKALPFAKLPAMLLYELPEVYVFNDQMGTRTAK